MDKSKVPRFLWPTVYKKITGITAVHQQYDNQ